MALTLLGFTAGHRLFSVEVEDVEAFHAFFDEKREAMNKRELTFETCGVTLPVEEVCIDVYDAGSYRFDLSRSFKVR